MTALSTTRLGELRGWTPEAIQHLGITINGKQVMFPVTDSQGRSAGRVRYQPDPRQRNGAPKSCADTGTKRELFPPIETLDTDGWPAWIVEGEPDAAAAHSVGLQATGLPGTSGWKREWATRFAGLDVIVCLDCDKPGRAAAEGIAADLSGVAKSVRVLDLDPTRDDGHDLTDVVLHWRDDLGKRIADIGAMLDKTAAETPPWEPSDGDEVNSSPRRLRRLDVARMIATDPPPVDWIVPGLLVRGNVTMLSGREGTGKSILAMGIAAAMSHGAAFLGERLDRGRVLYVDAENGPEEAHRRLHGLAVNPSHLEYLEADGFHLLDDLAELSRAVERARPDVVVLDSYASLLPGEIENKADHEAVLGPCRSLSRRFACSVLILHHESKGSAGYRGPTQIGAGVTLGFSLASEYDDPDEARRYLRTWKCRPAAKPPKQWLRIETQDGKPSIIVADPFVPEDAGGGAVDTALQAIVGAIAAAGRSMATSEIHALDVGSKSTVEEALRRGVGSAQLTKPGQGRYAVVTAEHRADEDEREPCLLETPRDDQASKQLAWSKQGPSKVQATDPLGDVA